MLAIFSSPNFQVPFFLCYNAKKKRKGRKNKKAYYEFITLLSIKKVEEMKDPVWLTLRKRSIFRLAMKIMMILRWELIINLIIFFMKIASALSYQRSGADAFGSCLSIRCCLLKVNFSVTINVKLRNCNLNPHLGGTYLIIIVMDAKWYFCISTFRILGWLSSFAKI